MTDDKRRAQHIAKVLVNEVFPRRKRFGCYPPQAFLGLLLDLEFDERLSRRGVRKLLDAWYVEQANA